MFILLETPIYPKFKANFFQNNIKKCLRNYDTDWYDKSPSNKIYVSV